MARLSNGSLDEVAQSDAVWHQRVNDAEQDYLRCLSEFGCDSGEAFSALWHLRQLKRQAEGQAQVLVAA